MNKKLIIAAVALLSLKALPIYAQLGEGTVQVTILDEKGKPVENAPIYIHGLGKTHYMGGKEIPGTMVIAMKPGVYSFSSAYAKHTDGYVDRFTSNEARVQVVEGDNVSLILALRPIQDMAPAALYAEMHPGTMTSALAQRITAPEHN